MSNVQRRGCRINTNIGTDSFLCHQCIDGVSRAIHVSVDRAIRNFELPSDLTDKAPAFKYIQHALFFAIAYFFGSFLPVIGRVFLLLQISLVIRSFGNLI